MEAHHWWNSHPRDKKIFLKLNKLGMIERLCRMIYLHLSLTIVGVHCLSIKVIYQATPVPSYRYLSLNAVPYEEIYSVILFNIYTSKQNSKQLQTWKKGTLTHALRFKSSHFQSNDYFNINLNSNHFATASKMGNVFYTYAILDFSVRQEALLLVL